MGNWCQAQSPAEPDFTEMVPSCPVENGPARRVATAVHDLSTPSTSGILDFQRGEMFIIENDSDPDWYLVRHINEQRRGFVPKSYFTVNTTVGIEDWFFSDINRADAERLLLLPENHYGAFLIRESNSPGAYALSIKDSLPDTNEVLVRHYKIRTLDNGGFFISPSTTFTTLQSLVEYYSESENGLCRRLATACLRPRLSVPGPLPQARDEYEIPFESLEFKQTLGKGHFGEVFYGLWNGSIEVAIKRLISSGVHSEEFKREVAVMKAINHPQIVRLFAICTEREPFCIVMEYLCHGNLLEYLKTAHGQQLRLPSLVNMAMQIADGMKYLESKHLIHRDLAARNILVGEGDIVKLADFGLARMLDDAVYVTSGGQLPIKWTAPEAYTSGKFTIKSDIWSFGIVLYELFTHGKSPYKGMKNQQVSKLVVNCNYRLPKPDDPECSDPVYDIMQMCWKKNPEERPTFEYLHDFFTNYRVASETSYHEMND